jgi:hypothetical protein
MTCPQIIGVTGRKFNGKDTIAELLCKKYDYIQVTFAGLLKDICKHLFKFTDEQLYGSLKEVEDPFWKVTPRDVFQYIGTDLFRKQMGKLIPGLGENFWVMCLKREIYDIINKNPNSKIVISDVRFPNEVDLVKELGGDVIRVTRESVNNVDNHESEKLIETLVVDKDFTNNTTVEDLHNAVHHWLKSLA